MDDLCQEVFVRAWQARDRYQPRSLMKTYLFGIAKNVLREHRRHESRCRIIPLRPSPSTVPQPIEILDNQQRQKDLENAVSQLPPKQREALEIAQSNTLSLSKAAEAVGLCSTALNQRLSTAKAYLAKLLKAYNPEE